MTLLIATLAIMEDSSSSPRPTSTYDPASPTQEAVFIEKEALPKQTKDQEEQETQATSLIVSNRLSLPLSSQSQSESPIQPGKRTRSTNPVTSPWKIQQRDPEEYEKNRVGKYADYFKGNEILPIPEILQKLEPRIVSLVVTDLKTRRLVGLKKEGFEDLLRKAGVPCQYSCRRSFAT